MRSEIPRRSELLWQRRDVGRASAGILALIAIAALIVAAIVWFAMSSGETASAIASRDEHQLQKPDAGVPAPSSSLPTMKPRPFSESEPAADDVATSRQGTLEIEVILPGGQPAPRARLVLHRGEEVLGVSKIGADGLARLPAGEGEATLLVVADGARAHATTILIEAGRRRIQLPSGVSIAGRVEVDGDAPRDPVTLRFSGDDNQLLMEMWKPLGGESTNSCTTNAAGRFEFAGLEAGSEWRVLPSLGYHLERVVAADKPVTAVTAPANDVVVKLARLPVVFGRVVDEDRKAPVAGATASAHLEGPMGSRVNSKTVEADGTFRLEVARSFNPLIPYERMAITIRGPLGAGERTIRLEPPPDRDRDLGDIALSRGRLVRFVVRDPAGAPIAGALAMAGGSGVKHSNPTDAEGKSEIAVGEEVREFRVGALKYEVVDVALPDPIPELVPVTLSPVAGIVVVVGTPAGLGHESYQVRLSAESPDVVDGQFSNDAIREAAGASSTMSASMDERQTILTFAADPDNRVVIGGVKPAVPITLEVLDLLGKVLAGDKVTLAAGEWKTVALRITETPRSIRGKVVDSTGRPVARAMIEAAPDAAQGQVPDQLEGEVATLSAQSNAEGRFVMSGVFATSVDLTARKQGYAALVRHGVPVPADGADVVLTLQKGCALTLEVNDAKGVPIPDLDILATPDGQPMEHAETKSPGVYVIKDLPLNSRATITFDWGERPWERVVVLDGDRTEKFTMPATGGIAVDWSAVADASNTTLLVNLAPTSVKGWSSGKTLAPNPDAKARWVFEIHQIAPGDYDFTVDPSETTRQAIPERVTVKPGETTRVVLRKP